MSEGSIAENKTCGGSRMTSRANVSAISTKGRAVGWSKRMGQRTEVDFVLALLLYRSKLLDYQSSGNSSQYRSSRGPSS